MLPLDRRHQEILHQDNLIWSRVQTLIAIQAGTLAGIYTIDDEDTYHKIGLAVLGITLTFLLWNLSELDRKMRQGARTAYGRCCAVTDEPPVMLLPGQWVFRAAIVLLILADIFLVHLELCDKWFVTSLQWHNGFGIGFASGTVFPMFLWVIAGFFGQSRINSPVKPKEPQHDCLDGNVFASRLSERDVSSLFLNQSHGCLVAAESIVKSAATNKHAKAFYHALPAMFALFHGVELFLKGAIHKLTTNPIKTTHDLKKLADEYSNVVRKESRVELAIKADIQRVIDWDSTAHGLDFRYVIDTDAIPYWEGIAISYRDIVICSHDYRREFARIRRILYGCKGFDAFWEEGTFASIYPEQAFWWFCHRSNTGQKQSPTKCIHRICDDSGRNWTAYEGEAITDENFTRLLVGQLPQHCRIHSSLTNLPTALAEQ